MWAAYHGIAAGSLMNLKRETELQLPFNISKIPVVHALLPFLQQDRGGHKVSPSLRLDDRQLP